MKGHQIRVDIVIFEKVGGKYLFKKKTEKMCQFVWNLKKSDTKTKKITRSKDP